MLEDIPYSTLKENRRSYEIMRLWDQGGTFAEIAQGYGISTVRVKQLYRRIKKRQLELYIRRISLALGHGNMAEVRREAEEAYRCYQGLPYIAAYLEKKYRGILEAYREGETGMSEAWIKSLPPLRRKLSKKMISRIVEMRETGRKSFSVIAGELGLTREKARHAYNMFYSRQVMAHVAALEEEADPEERWALRERYYGKNMSAKKRWDQIKNGEKHEKT